MTPEKVQEIIVTVSKQLAKLDCVFLSFDLWLTEKIEGGGFSNSMECVNVNTSLFTM